MKIELILVCKFFVCVCFQGNLKVQAIVLELKDSHGSKLRVENLSHMVELRLLIFHNVQFSGVLRYLPSSLQYISWHQCPFSYLPPSICDGEKVFDNAYPILRTNMFLCVLIVFHMMK